MLTRYPQNYTMLRVGDVIRVKPREAILKTLDSLGRLDGCLFTDQMWDYCNKSYRIIKVVKSIFNERQKRSFIPLSPLYILENLICEGNTDGLPFACDHSCWLLWHEKWLEK
jgi:hypothetical protein